MDVICQVSSHLNALSFKSHFCLISLSLKYILRLPLCLQPNNTSDYFLFSGEHSITAHYHLPVVLCLSQTASVSGIIFETLLFVARGDVKARRIRAELVSPLHSSSSTIY